VITESKSDGTTIEYIYGNDLLSQSGDVSTLYYLNDALGSTRALANSTGNITDNYTYSPYGALIEHLGTSSNNFMFTGEQFDKEIDSYYLRARYYAPNSARFISRDTYDGRVAEPITLNHYAYGNANPTRFVDPSGYVGIIEVQFSISIQSQFRGLQKNMFSKIMRDIARDLGCDIAVTYVKDLLTEGVGLYLFQTDNGSYGGRTNNFRTRFRYH